MVGGLPKPVSAQTSLVIARHLAHTGSDLLSAAAGAPAKLGRAL